MNPRASPEPGFTQRPSFGKAAIGAPDPEADAVDARRKAQPAAISLSEIDRY
jgi:hypothetical protein